MVDSLSLQGLSGPGHEGFDYRSLIRRRQIGLAIGDGVAQVADRVQQRRLQPAEAEVELTGRAAREVECLRVALAREPVDGRAAGVAEPEQAGALVERLAGGVVERLAEDV